MWCGCASRPSGVQLVALGQAVAMPVSSEVAVGGSRPSTSPGTGARALLCLRTEVGARPPTHTLRELIGVRDAGDFQERQERCPSAGDFVRVSARTISRYPMELGDSGPPPAAQASPPAPRLIHVRRAAPLRLGLDPYRHRQPPPAHPVQPDHPRTRRLLVLVTHCATPDHDTDPIHENVQEPRARTGAPRGGGGRRLSS